MAVLCTSIQDQALPPGPPFTAETFQGGLLGPGFLSAAQANTFYFYAFLISHSCNLHLEQLRMLLSGTFEMKTIMTNWKESK